MELWSALYLARPRPQVQVLEPVVEPGEKAPTPLCSILEAPDRTTVAGLAQGGAGGIVAISQNPPARWSLVSRERVLSRFK